jgi:purine-nucleoside phosphorylase
LDRWRKSAAALSPNWQDRAEMRARLRPTEEIAADAILVGDPGRAMLLAQELIEQPKMSNHARGLWGYSGLARAGSARLTVQSTGIGATSAALVLGELAELGVRRAIRVGTCLAPGEPAGSLLLVERAIAGGGSASAFGLDRGAAAVPDPELTAALGSGFDRDGSAVVATVASFDLPPDAGEPLPAGAAAADLQTVAVLASAARLGVAAAALLVADHGRDGELSDDCLAEAAKRAGRVAAAVL